MKFFNFDFENAINNGQWRFANVDGKDALQKRIHLETPEMGMYDVVDITQFRDGTYWIDFHSKKYAPNKQTMDFMAYCTNRWGNDPLGRGIPSEFDVEDLKRGTFGRTWHNVKIIQVKLPENFSLTISLRLVINNGDVADFINNLASTPSPPPPQPLPTNTKIAQPIPSLTVLNIILIILGCMMMPIGTISVLIYGYNRYQKTTIKVNNQIVQVDEITKNSYHKQGRNIMIIAGIFLLLFVTSLII